MDWNWWLPLIFTGLMALAMLVYVVLDGYDLGVGILMISADGPQRDRMIASIGPFWDANETWLVLAVGLLLVAFPLAHGVVLTALYLPVAAMLLGLILRGVAFDFRVKAEDKHKPWWNRAFFFGSLLASAAQGWMLGCYVLGFPEEGANLGFALLIAIGLCAGYALLGATWLLMKTEGDLRLRAARWAWGALWLTAIGIGAVSLATPMVSDRIYAKWFSLPEMLYLSPIPLLTGVAFVLALRAIVRIRKGAVGPDWMPFVCAASMYILAFAGLAYSLFPYLVGERIDIWQAAAAPASLKIILAGTAVTLPMIVVYTIYTYRVFHGRAGELDYG